MPNWPATNSMHGWLSRVSNLLSAIPAVKVRYTLLVLIGVWFLSLLADFFWMWFPVPVTAVNNPADQIVLPAGAVNQSRVSVDVEAMKTWYLFGSAMPSPGVETAQVSPDNVSSAAVTNLQLVLLGILLSDVPEESFAVIQAPGKSELVKVGDAIPVGNNVTLSKVLVDRVIINNNGNMESLLLYSETDKPMADMVQPATSTIVVDQRNNPELSMMANNYRNQLLTNPMSLTDVIKVSIAKDAEGRLIGYRIRPGRDRAQFAQFGLQTGDIVTSINGTPLDDPAKAMELYGQLREAKEASFVVRRGGEEINLIVGMGQ